MTAALFVSVSLFALPEQARAENPPFDVWLEQVRATALEQGIKPATLKVLDGLEPDPRVLKFDRRQPEFTQTFEEYLTARVTKYRIDKGRQYYRDNLEDLKAIATAYDVDPQFLVAFWGLESNFGSYQGKYSIIRSLATLGHDPRRTTFFTKELLKALTILDQGHIPAEQFVGGWAGAMGQNQFMPSSFLNYAQDFDKDGKKNIWSNQLDVWASIANYLQRNGWRQGEPWGYPVTLTSPIDFETLRPEAPKKGCRAYRHHTRPLSITEWQSKGVDVPQSLDPESSYAMVIADEGEQNAYLVGPNFRGILSYNCANKYAVSVGLLADEILRD